MADDIEGEHKKVMLVYKLSDEDKRDVAKYVVKEFMDTLQIGVGKSILDNAWKMFVAIMIALAIYGYAATHKLP